MAIKTLMLTSENWETYPSRDLSQLVEAVKIAEDAGIDYVAMSEHIVLGATAGAGTPKFNAREYDAPGNQSPFSPCPSSLMLLAAFAAVTTRIGIVAGAVIPPLRHPLLIAKELATLDLFSKGRLVVFPTVSWHEDEYRAVDVAFNKRGKMLDEHLEIWQKVWAESPASFSGEFYSFNDVYLEPKPWRPKGPDLWITGDKLHPAALRRLVRYGTGFAPLGPVPAEDMAKIDAAMLEAGRDRKTLEFMGIIPGEFKSSSGVADIDEALKMVPMQIAGGITTFTFKPSQFIEKPSELAGLCRHIVATIRSFES